MKPSESIQTGAGTVRRALARINIADLRVELVDDGVHLHGVAHSYAEKRLAGELAAAAASVPVTNELRIAQCGFGDDERVLQDVARELARLPHDAAAGVTVDVHDGVATLRGTTHTELQRKAISSAVAKARGVARIEDHLVPESVAVSDDDVARSLSEYVHRATRLPRGAVTVDFSAGVASLAGSVPSDVQRHAIEDLIRWHHGVQDVQNHLAVIPATGRSASMGTKL